MSSQPNDAGTTTTRPAAAAGSATAWSRAILGSAAQASSRVSGSAAMARRAAAKAGSLLGEQVEQHGRAARRTCRRSSGSGRWRGSPRRRRPTASRRTRARRARRGGRRGRRRGGRSRTPTRRTSARCRSSPASRRGRRRPRSRPRRRTPAGSAMTWSAAKEPMTASGSRTLEHRRGQADGGHRVARRRLGDDRVAGDLGQLGGDGVAVRAAGHDQEPVLDQRARAGRGCPAAASGRCR